MSTLRLYSCALWLGLWSILLLAGLDGTPAAVVLVAGLAATMVVSERERARKRREWRRP